jgi:DNA primase
MISEFCVEKIKGSTKIEDIIPGFIPLIKSGSSLTGECPFCGQKKKFFVTPSKQIYKCFKCGKGGNHAISFLREYKKMSYPEALRYCAGKKGIPVEEEENDRKLPGAPPFRDQQLRQSGIPDNCQTGQLVDGTPINRYEAGTIGKNWKIVSGDDLVLNYVGLEGRLTVYTHPETGRPTPFVRVRFKYPQEHKDRNGHPIKYLQPSKSGSHLWIPETARKACLGGDEAETLFVTEGEKKADKLCIHGMMAVGIMGIHNLSLDEKMTDEFKKFIQRCQVKHVVFLLDADWQDLSAKEDTPVEARPATFFSAVKKFRDYFYHFNKDGIHLDIYLACLKKNRDQEKGVDDLLANSLKGKEEKLLGDFEMAKADRQGNGEYLVCHNITTLPEYKLKALWHLQDVHAFAAHHKEVLVKRGSFRFKRREWTFGENEELVVKNPLQPEEQYWRVEENTDRGGKLRRKYLFNYQNIRIFLRNRGFGRLALPNGKYRFVQQNGKVLKEVNPVGIQNYVTNYTEDIGENEVLEMILRGGSQYLGPDKLDRLYEFKPEFMQPEPDSQYLFFKNCYWKITAEGITQKPLDDLPACIWEQQIIPFEPESLAQPMVEVARKNGKFLAGQSGEAEKCHFLQFIERTSTFDWKDYHELQENEKGLKKWVPVKPLSMSDRAGDEFTAHVVSKLIAMGYLLHAYHNKSEARAIICMDGTETEVGTSEGGTGKSIFGKSLEYVVSVVTIDGKKHKLAEDNFLYEEVDERTKVLFFDDCRTNLDFEHFFGQITTGITVNGKGVKRYSLPAPKFLFTTNHAINGEGNSFKRRQYLVSFSDWYNEYRTPKDEFGCILFDDWDYEQWNLFYNTIACCIQTYLKYGLQYTVPSANLEKRKLRQQTGESILEWASVYFDQSGNRNKRVNKKVAYDDYKEHYPSYTGIQQFKKKVKLYCRYAGLHFNPNAPGGEGGDIKSNGKEYFVVADENFDANQCETIDA